ncbi:Nonribosomal peptide synthetase easA, partial [Lasiodiplodia hormozganensis]
SSPSSPTTPVTLATTLRTAWALLLASYTNQPDILFAAIVSGRQAPLPGIADALAGPTIAAVPVRIACTSTDKLSAVLLRVQDDAAAMAPHEALGLRGVQGVLARSRDMAAARAAVAGVRTLFVVQPPKASTATGDRQKGEWEVESKAVEVGSSYSYPVTVVCEPQADGRGVEVEVVYASGAMGRAEVEGMVGRFEEVVRRLVVDGGEGVVRDVLEAVGRGSSESAAAAAAGELGAAVDEDVSTRSGSETRSSEMERRLQEMWAESLGLDDPQEVGVQDDFLRLGGDSLTAMQLSGVARREGFSLRVVDIMKMPVLRDMAQCMTALGGADKKNDTDAAPFSLMPDASSEHVRYAAADCKVTVGDVEDMYPCTPLQEGLMTASGKQAGSYVAQIVLDLKRGTDMERFKAAWESVVATHHILRTRIVHLGEAGMFQAVLKASKPAINWRTASSVDAYVKRDRTIPMSFGDELSRYAIITSNKGNNTFIWTAHHAIYDGATVAMLSDAVSAAYHQSNTAVTVPPPPFSRFIKYLNTLSPAASDTFWRTTLGGATTPTPFPLPLILDYTPRASRTVSRAISLPLSPRSSSNSNITTATLLQTAWALVLSRYASSTDVTLGIAQSGRLTPVADVASLPGPTLTTAPLRINLGNEKTETVAALLQRVQDQSTAAIPHCHRGLQAIRRLGDDAAAACEFRTLLTLNPEKREKKVGEKEEELVCDLVHGGRVLDTGAFHTYPLLLECVFDNADDNNNKANVRASATHDDRVLAEPLVERMVAQFEHVLRQLLAAADGGLDLAVADVEVLTAEDLESLRQRDAWVVDVRNRDALVPMGVVGELVVEKAEAGCTAVQPAWLEKLGFARSKRVYATGRLARLGEDGEVEVIGDMHELVELQDGRRFVARDVEKMVSQVMWDRQVAIQVTDEGSLTAFVALEHGYVDDEVAQKLLDALVTSAGDRLSRALPSFMLPKAFLPVRSLPRTAAGNIDRLQLREMVATKKATPDAKEISEQEVTRGPSEMEQRLLALWKSVLGLDNIAVCDSFLRLGGDSLDAMKLVSAARRQDIVLTVKDIFENPVLADMAQLATKPEPTAASYDAIEPFSMMNGNTNALVEEVAAACQIDADAIEDIYPCAPLQEGLMALSNVERGAYVAECVIPVPDSERAVAAWKALVATTPVLRTRITQLDQWGSVQVVVKEQAEIVTGNNLDDYLREARQIPMSSGNRLVRAGVVITGTSQHLVLFTHHSVFDGWSWKLILQQLYSLYQEQTVPQSPPYNKFIQYLNQGLHPDEAEDYWRSYLEGAERTAFPPVSSSIVPQPDSHETRRIILGRSGENTSSSMIQTAWALLVSRYTDSKDVVIGVTLSGRTAPVDGIQDMIGPTFATIPLRFILDGTMTVTELAKNAQDVSINPVQHLGLQRIRQVSASAHAACTFNSLLVVQPASAEDDDSSDNFFMSENDAQLVSSFTNYGFVLLCQMLPDGNIDASLVFDSRLTSNRQAHRLLGQFEHVLQQISDGAAQTVHDIDYLSPEDMKEVSEFNRELDPVPYADLCMHDLVKHHARIRPNAPAVSSWDGDLTYAELDVLATQLAGHLTTSMGIGPGNTVPLCFEKSKWTQVAMLGVMKAGAAFLLLDPAHPLARLESICRKVHATTVIVSTGLDALLTHAVRHCLVLDEMTTLLPTDPCPPVTVTPSDAAYVVTTSGTSGAAKACVITHGAIVAGALSFAARAHVNARTRAMQFASYSFDASIIETLMIWAAGGCTCVLSETQRKDDPAAAIAARRANWALMTPSLAGVLDPAAVPSMETVVLGGEAATAELLATWGKSVTLLQAYGPCECTPVACCSLAPMDVESNPRNIGRPLSGVRAWIVDPDAHDRLAPVGAVGELVLEGPTVGRGYVDDADKTAAAFIAAPKWRERFAGRTDQRFYKTGDLVRYAEDGNGTLEFVGRKDAQIKVRGQRIELAEIEQNLRRCVGTVEKKCDVAVELVTPEGGNAASAYLAAFVAFGDAYDQEMDDQDKLTAVFADAKAKLGEALPSYMVPRVFLPLRQLPLSAAGKVDRKALRQMAAAMNQNRELETQATTGSAPTTGMEQILQSLWARVLDVQVDAVHTDANFIELGGDSLSAMKLAAKARQAGLSLTVADIMRRPRFAEMAAKCEPSAEMEPTTEYKPFSAFPEGADVDAFLRETLAVDRNEVEDVIEATSVQKAMTEAAMSPHQGTVNHVWLHFSGPIDKQRVKDACSRVVAHHGILRTVFVPFKQQLMQVVFRSHEPEWEEHITKDDIEDATAAIVSASRQRPEQYGKHGLRFSFLTDRQQSASRLIIRIPHNLYDGITLPLILDDLRAAYEQRDLPSVPSFPSHLHAWRHRQSTSGAEAFWRSELKGSRMTPIIATDARRDSHTAVDNAATATTTAAAVNGHITQHIALGGPAPQQTTKTKHTFETLFHTAWALVLRSVSNADDVVFARAIANRALPLPSAASVCGPTLNTVPVRVNLAKYVNAAGTTSPATCEDEADALLSAVEDARLAALPYECLETERLVRRCTDWCGGGDGEALPRFGSLLLWNNIAAAKTFDEGCLPAWGEGAEKEEAATTTTTTRCELGWAVAPWDAADVQVTATPVPGNSSSGGSSGGVGGIRIDVLFAEERVSRDVAGRMVEMLCRNVEELWRGGEGVLKALLLGEEGAVQDGGVLLGQEQEKGGGGGGYDSSSLGDMSPDHAPTPESYEIVSSEGWGEI